MALACSRGGGRRGKCTEFVRFAYARGGVLLDLRKGGVSSQGPPRPCSPLTYGTALDIVRPFSRFFMAIDEVKIAE